ncbi:MAG TPA: hypothetical protein VK821_16220 [Dehalococcoidia bacterium]|nr:hypothetical protein [Dehalococcoidia bacterium]
MIRPTVLICATTAVLLLCGCLSANPNTNSAAPAGAPAQTAASAPPNVSQPQPGATGAVISGTVTLTGAPPPPNSSLFLGLVKSPSDQQPTVCIDAERDPVDPAGKFTARVACSPQAGDQLTYTLVIGSPGERNWHTGFAPIPADLTNLRIDAP